MKLLDQVSTVIRRKHYSLKTEKTYRQWIVAFLRFHRNGRQWRHPLDMGAAEIESYLSHLAVDRRVAATTQNQALNAIVFLYKQVLGVDPGQFNAVRAKRPKRLPTVLSRRDVHAVIERIRPPVQLIAQVMYGGGLRLGEACSLRLTNGYYPKNSNRE